MYHIGNTKMNWFKIPRPTAICFSLWFIDCTHSYTVVDSRSEASNLLPPECVYSILRHFRYLLWNILKCVREKLPGHYWYAVTLKWAAYLRYDLPCSLLTALRRSSAYLSLRVRFHELNTIRWTQQASYQGNLVLAYNLYVWNF